MDSKAQVFKLVVVNRSRSYEGQSQGFINYVMENVMYKNEQNLSGIKNCD